MNKYIEVFSFEVPVYSICVYTGIIIINIIALYYLYKNNLDIVNFFCMEFIGGISAICGAKILVVFEKCIYSFLKFNDFKHIEKTGYAYYGGLFALYLSLFLCDKYLNRNFKIYAQEMIFLLPLLHMFWKIGCFCGGCCIGIPYEGILSIIYPLGVNELSGVKSFPIQIFEGFISFVISMLLCIYKNHNKSKSIPMYLILYGSTRFFAEFFRYHETKVMILYSLTLSIICTVIGLYVYKKCLEKDVKEHE